MEKDNKTDAITDSNGSASGALAFFVNDQSAWYLYKKAEKISKAFFLLTKHLPEENMLKTRIREKALDLISRAQLLLSSEGTVEAKNHKVVLEILSLISLSDTALAAEEQSERNHSIIVRELEKFISDLSTWSREKVASSYIPTSLFDMSDMPAFNKIPSSTLNNSLNFIAGPSASIDLNKGRTSPVKGPQVKNLKPKNDTNVEAKSDMRKDGRQESILQAIRDKGEVSIKDLVSVVKGCSEKTIQRELVLLVNSGVLSKVGERRWSRYSII